MALIAYRTFSGEIPRVAPHLLPNGTAQEAVNCIFTAGVLQSTRDGLLLQEMQSNPVRGIYTQDGISFYSWTDETRAFRSPIKSDTHNRVYFLVLQEGVFKVTSSLNMSADGITPLPSNCFRVGVPTPTQAPTLELVDRDGIPDHEAAILRIYAWWEDAGQRFAYGEAIVTTIAKFKHYEFTPPIKTAETPAYAVLRCRAVLEDGGAQLAQVTLDVGEPAVSNAFPGEQSYTLEVSNGKHAIHIDWGVYNATAYQFTCINDWNEEGAPSPAAIARPTYLQDVRIQVVLPSDTGFKPIAKVQHYRTYGATATFVQVEATPEVDHKYLDKSRDASGVGLAITSEDYEPPPTDLQGVEVSPNGVFAFFKENQLYLSEPYLPHAASYIYTFSHAVRAVQAGQQSFVVTTADGLYLLAGVSPGAMQPMKLPQPQPGIAQRSMVDVDGGAIYASGDGLVFVGGTQTSTELSQSLFGREVWRKQYGDMVRDASLRLSYHDGHLLVSSDKHDKGFVLRLDETQASLSRHTQRMDCTFQLPVEDALYYSVGNALYQFQAGTQQEFYWRGREEIFPQAQVFGAGFLRSDNPVQLMLWCDDILVYDQRIEAGHFRLPAKMPRCLRMVVAVRGTGKLYELCLAQSMTELRNG